MSEFTLPDLRFEQTFMKSLYSYSGRKNIEPEGSAIKSLTEEELELVNEDMNGQKMTINNDALQPLGPITPSIVAYAIIKDQILMPLIQGFIWSGFLISTRPLREFVIKEGLKCGSWLYNFLGLNTFQGLKRRSS